MAECSLDKIELLWKIMIYHNRPINSRLLITYLEQFMSRNEAYNLINCCLVFAIIDKEKNNQYCLSKSYWLVGSNFILSTNINIDDFEVIKSKNEFRQINDLSCITIIERDKIFELNNIENYLNYNFKNICESIGLIEKNIFNCFEPIENIKHLGFPFIPYSNIFSEKQLLITENKTLFKKNINSHYSQYFYKINDVFYVIKQDSKEILDTIKLVSQIGLSNKFIYNIKDNTLRIQYCSIPYFIERIFFINHIMNTGNIPFDRKYFINKKELEYLNKSIFNNKIFISYE